MSFLSRRNPYDRKRLLARAEAIEKGWRWRSALAIYRQVLAAEPHNAEIHARVAPLLARSGRDLEAWESFRIAIGAMRKDGEVGGARALEELAVRALPRRPEPVRLLARSERARQQPAEAVRVLLEGSRRMARRGPRGAAILLLRDARAIEAWNVEVVLSLGRHLSRDGQPAEALFLLDHLEQRTAGRERCAVRALLWQIEPSLRHSWRWFRAVLEARRSERDGGHGHRRMGRPARSRS